MIVKILGNKGGGSAGAVIDYMLGKDKDRDGAILLSGDPDLTARLADNLDFQNRYTVGVLSFEEPNLKDHIKQEIMQDFEKTLLAGLERDQYDITWIEHTDKGRLELNFIIPNVELSTGKRLQPYYDKVDRPLVENWKQKTNFEHGLSDPHAPEKAQAIKTLNSQNLPPSVKDIKEQIGLVIADQIGKGNIQDRKDVIQTLEVAGFEITRQTDRSISIKNPDGKRNIRLEGTIYENRQFDQKFAEEHNRARAEYQGTSRERYATALGKLQSLVESKRGSNSERYQREFKVDSSRTIEDQKRTTFEYIYRGSAGLSDSIVSIPNSERHLVREKRSEQATTVGNTQLTDRVHPIRAESFKDSDDIGKQGQNNVLHQSKRQQDIGSLYNPKRQQGAFSKTLNNPFDKNPFDHALNRSNDKDIGNLWDVEYLYADIKNTQKSSLSQSQANKAKKPNTSEQEDAKRLYESLQRFIRLIREAIERVRADKEKSDRADRAIDNADRAINDTESRIERTKSGIKQSEQQIKGSEQQISQQIKEKQAERKVSRGFGR